MTSNALPARQDTQGRQAVPSYPHIIRALNMVREEAEITQIELELKSDPVISYRLMMHVNAAGMGFPRQIRSYRQAISILGYHQLYRWLVRLLVTADPSDRGTAIGRNAVIRGRFLELVARTKAVEHPEDELFVVGAFSLLEDLFGEPMELLLEDLRIAEPVRQALVARVGPYAPLLHLAEAIEAADEPGIAAALDALPELTIDLVFETYQQALAWAEALDA